MPNHTPWRHKWPHLPHPTKEQFLACRRRRFGRYNPDLVTSPFLDFMVRTRAEPFWLRELYGWDPDGCSTHGEKDETAIWSFDRIGQTVSLYLGIYRIHIGGEHDDWYDPDFLIYNDVIVEGPSDEVSIYGYPRDVFPPTDFHSATIITDDEQDVPRDLPDSVLIIGGLGYEADREFWKTPIYRLDLGTMEICELETSGDTPGWIHGHRAALIKGGKIFLSGGKILNAENEFCENEERFELDLWTRVWRRRT